MQRVCYLILLLFSTLVTGCEVVHQFAWKTNFDQGKIFVSVKRGDDNNKGRRNSPFKSINTGIFKALELGYKTVVIEAGEYTKVSGGLTGPGTRGVLLEDVKELHLSGGWIDDFSKQGSESERTIIGDFRLPNPGDYENLIVLQNADSISFENLVFSNIESTAANGTALQIGSSKQITFSDCDFINNFTRGTSGGAVHAVNSSSISFNNCIFSENRALPGILNGRGGALSFLSCSSVTIKNCNFVKNRTDGFGSAVYFGTSSSNITIESSRFEKNLVIAGNSNLGGTVMFDQCNSITLNYTAFSDNELSASGGGLYIQNSDNITINNGDFTNNRLIQNSSVGSAIYCNNSTNITINKGRFTGNFTPSQRGAVNIRNSNSAAVRSSLFKDNISDSNLGYCSLAIETTGTIEVSDSTFFSSGSSTSPGQGAILLDFESSLDFIQNNCNHTGNYLTGFRLISLQRGGTGSMHIINNFFNLNPGLGAIIGDDNITLQPYRFESNVFKENTQAVLYEINPGPAQYTSIDDVNNPGSINANSASGNILKK